MRPWLLLLTLLWPLLAQDERDAAKKNKTEKVGNPKTAVVASCGLAHTFITEDCGLQTTTRFSPLSRQGVSALPQKNGADDKRSMEMWTMQKAKQTQRLFLWCVWPAMGTVLGQTIPTPLQLCNGWFNTQAEESMEGVALGILGSTAKEPEKKSLQKPSKQGQRKGRWEREIHASQGYCSWRTEKFPEMACPRPGLHQHQGGGHNRAASSENASWTQTTGILSRSTGLDRHAPGLLSRWSPLRVAGQSGQDQENIPNGSAKAHWATHESQKRTGCTEGGQVSPQGGVEATRGTTGQEHQSTALAVSECHPGLQQLRGGFGATVPGCKNGYFADHPTEQASRRRSTSPQRHGCCDADGKPYDTHQCRRRSKYAWRCRSTRRGSTSATNPIYLVRVRGITDLREDEATSGRWTRRRTCHQNCQDCKCSQAGFMNSRCGMQPTRQSVFTEHDRSRNLRFSACVGVCEHSYVGTACEQYPFCQANFEWKVLGEPKMPTTTCPRTCMTTDEAVLSTQHHTVHLERDYLDPWGAIAQAFELELDVARDGWAQVPVIDDTPLPILQCRPNHDEQSRHPDGPADDQDDLVMMQQSALPRPSSSPTLKTVRLVGTHSTSAMIQMDTTEQFSTELETRWPFHRRSHDDIEAVHEVTDPPTFSGQAPDPMYIIEFRDDRFSQTHTDDVMGLVTIIFDETTEGLRRERLRVQWLPHKASRDNLLDFLRATWFCRRQDVICTLYHDGWLWPVHDQTLRTLDYGDHVRLQLRSSGPGFCDMQFSEGVSRQRKIYESSSEVEEREEEPEQEESERGGAASSQRTARSRSRGRPHADGENTDSNSLLQLTAKKVKGTRPALQEITNTLGRAHALCLDEALEPMELGKSHVLDLWCTEPTTPVAGPQQVCRAPLVLCC